MRLNYIGFSFSQQLILLLHSKGLHGSKTYNWKQCGAIHPELLGKFLCHPPLLFFMALCSIQTHKFEFIHHEHRNNTSDQQSNNRLKLYLLVLIIWALQTDTPAHESRQEQQHTYTHTTFLRVWKRATCIACQMGKPKKEENYSLMPPSDSTNPPSPQPFHKACLYSQYQ